MLRPTLRREAGAASLIALAALLAYLPALGAGFVYDDHALVESSAVLRGPLWRVWFSTAATDWWPLTWTSLWIEWRLWGASPAGYHATSVLLHGLVAVLLWRTLRALEVPGAWLGGLAFALHPVAVDSVAWIAERKNTLSGALYLATLLCWLRFRAGRRGRWYAAALAAFALALTAKASVVMLPVVLLGIGLWRRERPGRRELLQVAPFFALSLAAGLVNVWFQHHLAMVGTGSGRGVAERVGGAGWALLSYLERAYVPVRVAVLYPPWPVAPSSAAYWLPLAVLVAAAALLCALRARGARPALFALGHHALVLAPVLGLLDMAYLRIAPVSNHLQYLALMGPAAIAGAGLDRLIRRSPRVGRAAVAVLAVGLGAFTYARAGDYHSDVTLWQAAVQALPDSAFAHSQLSGALGEAGRVEEAILELQRAIAATPAGEGRRQLEGLLFLYEGNRLEAARVAREGLDAPDPDARRDAAWLLLQAGDAAGAARAFEALADEVPTSSDYAYWLGAALMRIGRLEDAATALGRHARLRPGSPKVEEALAFVLVALGRAGEAREHLARALDTAPGDPRVASKVDEWTRARPPGSRN